MNQKKNKPSAVFKVGAISLAFLIIGYQAALFMNHAAVVRIVANRDSPDTVYVYCGDSGEDVRKETHGVHSQKAENLYGAFKPSGSGELFAFNPNTATREEFQRLGFTPKQAASLIAYREKGGRFRRKSDFARSYVVSEQMYAKLEPYLEIPLVDINSADSAAFDALPGIGPYFASRMVSYRKELGGYSCAEQLMDIRNFGAERYEALKDLITCERPEKGFGLWTLPPDSLRRHPYIRSMSVAKAIVLYRENTPDSLHRIYCLSEAGIIPDSVARKLERCFIEGEAGVSDWSDR